MPKHPILLEVASSSSDRALWSDGARAVAVRWPFGYRAAISPGTMPRACMNVLVAMPKSDSPLGIPTRYTLHTLDAWVGSASSQESWQPNYRMPMKCRFKPFTTADSCDAVEHIQASDAWNVSFNIVHVGEFISRIAKRTFIHCTFNISDALRGGIIRQ